jgi:hypothetical protein
METKKIIQFTLLFFLLTGFSLISLGFVNARNDFVRAVSQIRERNNDAQQFVQVVDEAYDAKVFQFLKTEKVCALTKEQAEKLAELYTTQNKIFDVDGQDVNVLYIMGNPLNKDILEKQLGENIDTANCQVVHGNKVVALISPIFVS